MAPRGLFEKPFTDTEDGPMGKTSPALLFGVVAAVTIALMVLIGIASQNVGSRFAQQLSRRQTATR